MLCHLAAVLEPSRLRHGSEAVEAVWGGFSGEIGRFWAVSGPMLHRRRNVVQRVDIVAVSRGIENFPPSPTFFLDRFRAVRPDFAMENVFNSLDGTKIPRFRARRIPPGNRGTGPEYSNHPQLAMASRAVSGPVTLPNFRILHYGPSLAVLTREKNGPSGFPNGPDTRATIGPQGRLTRQCLDRLAIGYDRLQTFVSARVRA